MPASAKCRRWSLGRPEHWEQGARNTSGSSSCPPPSRKSLTDCGWPGPSAGGAGGPGKFVRKVAKAGQLDQLLAIMLLIASIGIAVDGLVFKRLEHAVRVRW